MRKFIVTINGNDYEVGVEEIGADEGVVNTIAAAPVAAAPAQQAAPVAVNGEKNSFALSRTHQKTSGRGRFSSEKRSAHPRPRSDENGQRYHRSLRRQSFL